MFKDSRRTYFTEQGSGARGGQTQMFETSARAPRATPLVLHRSRLNTTAWKLASGAHTRLCDLHHLVVVGGNDSISLTALTVSCLLTF